MVRLENISVTRMGFSGSRGPGPKVYVLLTWGLVTVNFESAGTILPFAFKNLQRQSST